jgi:hypothetical protein
MVEVLKFTVTHLSDAQTVFEIARRSSIPAHFGFMYLLLLTFWLIAHVMEA